MHMRTVELPVTLHSRVQASQELYDAVSNYSVKSSELPNLCDSITNPVEGRLNIYAEVPNTCQHEQLVQGRVLADALRRKTSYRNVTPSSLITHLDLGTIVMDHHSSYFNFREHHNVWRHLTIITVEGGLVANCLDSLSRRMFSWRSTPPFIHNFSNVVFARNTALQPERSSRFVDCKFVGSPVHSFSDPNRKRPEFKGCTFEHSEFIMSGLQSTVSLRGHERVGLVPISGRRYLHNIRSAEIPELLANNTGLGDVLHIKDQGLTFRQHSSPRRLPEITRPVISIWDLIAEVEGVEYLNILKPYLINELVLDDRI